MESLLKSINIEKFNSLVLCKPELKTLRGELNSTLLHKATKYGLKECVEALIHAGHDIDEKNDDDWVALHSAVWYHYVDITDLLLRHNPSLINAKTKNNQTPLHLAAFYNHEPMVETILRYPGVDVCVNNQWGETAETVTTSEKIKTMIQTYCSKHD